MNFDGWLFPLLWQASVPADESSLLVWVVLALLLAVVIAWLLGRDQSAAPAPAVELPAQRAQGVDLHAVGPVSPVVAAPPATSAVPASAQDDLTLIEGIGPKIKSVLYAAGLHTFADVAKTEVEELRQILLASGLRVNNPATWPQQATLAAEGKLEELKALQQTLNAGRRE